MVIPIGEGLDIETSVIGYTNRRRFGYFFVFLIFLFLFSLRRNEKEKEECILYFNQA